VGPFGNNQKVNWEESANIMFRDIFPLKDENNPDPEKRIDCGPPSFLELLTGRQQIAFNIKGQALLNFDLPFRLYKSQLERYVEILKEEFPTVLMRVRANTIRCTIRIEQLCNSFPLTTELTPASQIHDEAYTKIRRAMSVIEEIYQRTLELHLTTGKDKQLERGRTPIETVGSSDSK
jgi:hypothetical protein